ncbi:MAG: TonB-dependent receptor [Deltaproteobacteria bacterium]|nr:TonB-dependent receptor [Deltaproteobacteria bacterium]
MKKRYFYYLLTLTIGFIIALGDASALFAQETATDEFTLEEITVTAQKREENQQRVPIAMEVISGEALKEIGKNDIDQILSTVSSVIINKAVDGMRVTLRGMANDQNNFGGMQASTPTVAVNMDGAFTQRNAAGNNLYDIERVEVLYGPQSTMYSSSTPGGVVNVITASPKLDKFEGSVTLEGGNYNLKNGQLSLNVPVMSKLAMRVAANMSKRDGYLSNGAEDEDTKSVRLKALYQANEDLSFQLIGEYSKSAGQGFGGVDLFIDQDDVDNPWIAQQSEQGGKPNEDSINKKYSGRIDWDLGFASLAIVPSYTPRDSENTTVQTSRDGSYETSNWRNMFGDEKSVEARMTSGPDAPFTWIFGLTYYHSWEQVYSDSTRLDNGELDSYTDRYQNNRSKAVFGNVTYPVTDRFRATAGMRYTDESNYSYNLESGRNMDEYGNPQPEIVNMQYSDPDFKVGIEYDLAENSMLYSDFSTSYRTQGMAYDENGDPLPPEKLKSLTVGSKNRFFGNRMQVNAAAYYYWYKNYLATTGVDTLADDYVGVSPQTGLPVTAANGVLEYTDVDGDGEFTPGTDIPLDTGRSMDQNAKQVGDAKVYGIDISTNTMVTQRLKVDFSVSYLKKTFTDLFFDFNNITNALGIDDLDYSGREFTYAPHWTLNLGFSYVIPMGSYGTLTPSFDTKYQTSYNMYMLDVVTGISRDATTGVASVTLNDIGDYTIQEAYHISNFNMVYAPNSGKWTLSGYVKNLENYAVKRSIMIMGNASDMMIGPPRTYGGVLTVRF